MLLKSHGRQVALMLVLLLALVAWDASALDLDLARLAGGAHGFAWRDHWLLTDVLHEGGRRLGWFLVLTLCVAVGWPFGPLQVLSTGQRTQLAVGVLLSLLTVFLLKSGSRTSCPWDLADFGSVAQYASHWSRLADGGPGRCFPAGHASSGFAFVGGYFVFRRQRPDIARSWLAVSILAGLLLGLAQQLRGAHFMSHTLWTGWICWCVSWLLDAIWNRFGTWQAVAGSAGDA